MDAIPYWKGKRVRIQRVRKETEPTLNETDMVTPTETKIFTWHKPLLRTHLSGEKTFPSTPSPLLR
ncbi:MAG: hypothetical protein CMN03_09090 [Roseibacillus sp.]|nr:hypothetical protein [Roseibacillus sp.]